MPALTALSTQKKSPKWSFRGKHASEAVTHTPGPGAYTPAGPESSSKFKRGPRTMFGSSQRDGKGNTVNPGPGQYSPRYENLQKVSPRFGFGTSVRAGSNRSPTPGPGSYNANTSIGNDMPKYTMRIRHGLGDKKIANPGPGAYSPQACTHGSFGGSSKAVQQSSPKWGFGTAARTTSGPGKATPGPGTYDSFRPGPRSPAYTMRNRHADLGSRTSTPGPGAHGDVYTQFV